jgi:predicted ArsR family transcriptional regulator
MATTNAKSLVYSQILIFCTSEHRSLSEIAEHLGMNKHTLRAHYLYPLRNEGKLVVPKGAIRSGTKYLTKK